MSGSADRILFLLKTAGPADAAELAGRLAVTPQAVRQQLDLLQAEGLLRHEDEVKGPGRPKRVWRLSEKGHARFPDSHGALMVEFLEAIRESLGPEAIEAVVAAREARMLEDYKAEVRREKKLGKRLEALAALRSAEGYMARVEKSGEGFLLIEDHCPICSAAAACQGFCRSELALFRAVLGKKAKVERSEHLLAGARRCAYRVVKAKGAAKED